MHQAQRRRQPLGSLEVDESAQGCNVCLQRYTGRERPEGHLKASERAKCLRKKPYAQVSNPQVLVRLRQTSGVAAHAL
jgi:hypothetical protein